MDANERIGKMQSQIVRLEERQKVNEARLTNGQNLFDKLGTAVHELTTEMKLSREERAGLHAVYNHRMQSFEEELAEFKSAMTDFKQALKDHMDKEERAQSWLLRLLIGGLVSGALGVLFWALKGQIGG